MPIFNFESKFIGAGELPQEADVRRGKRVSAEWIHKIIYTFFIKVLMRIPVKVFICLSDE